MKISQEGLAERIRMLLLALGEDPSREGLKETPMRAAAAWLEWTDGYHIDADTVLKKFDGEGYNDLVIVHNISVQSFCEHHLAPINGYAHVGYIPSGPIVGLSKLARVVHAYARRLTVQERITKQVADCIQRNLSPEGIAVLIRAEHGCMSSRGVRLHSSVTTTSAMRGSLMDDPAARAEFLQLCLAAEQGVRR